MESKYLLDLLFESSSLKSDLLDVVKAAILSTLDNIELSDELCARVDDNTYEFIKSYKEGR